MLSSIEKKGGKTRKEKNTTDTPNTKIKGYFLNSFQKYETKIAARREV